MVCMINYATEDSQCKFPNMVNMTNHATRRFTAAMTIVIRPGKTNHVGTSEMHFVAPYHRYTHTLSKDSDNIRGARSAFPHS